MKNINKFILSTLVLTSCFFLNSSTYPFFDTNAYFDCTPATERAQRTVKYFLQLEQFEEQRLKSGTVNIPIDQISHIDNNLICSKLNNLVNSSDKLKHDETSYTRYYYQTSDFYFIFYKPNQVKMGITKFIVVNKSYVVKGIFGI